MGRYGPIFLGARVSLPKEMYCPFRVVSLFFLSCNGSDPCVNFFRKARWAQPNITAGMRPEIRADSCCWSCFGSGCCHAECERYKTLLFCWDCALFVSRHFQKDAQSRTPVGECLSVSESPSVHNFPQSPNIFPLHSCDELDHETHLRIALTYPV